MMVRTLSTVLQGSTSMPTGSEFFLRDPDALALIESGAAEPATRGAKKRYAEILAIRNAERAAAQAESIRQFHTETTNKRQEVARV